MSMNQEDFLFYKKFLYEKAGLAISEEKIYLLESRLTPVAHKRGLCFLEELTKALRSAPSRELVQTVIDAMTTNETLFFRDDRPFKQFKETVLPTLLKSRENKKSLRIWSAACSTGQEPFSIAMTMLEEIKKREEWRLEILGTDISETALAQACSGTFNHFEIQRGLPIQMIMKYFHQDGNSWKINDKVRNMVRFENFNLLEPMDRFGTFDIIFCRNVLIYFDEPTKKAILKNLAKRLSPDGFLYLGGSETVIGLCPDFKINPACPGLYTLHNDQTKMPTPSLPIPPLDNKVGMALKATGLL